MENVEEKIKKASEAFDKSDYRTSFEILKPLAEQGDAKAQFNLGFLYRIGHGVNQNYKKAYHWYSLAAEQGYAEAQYKIGLMYYKGQVVAQDYQKAFKWYSLAAKQDDPKAQFNLGVLYRRAEGVAQDHQQAFKWFLLAGERGYARAQFTLGGIYANGEGVSQDYQKALEYYKKSETLFIKKRRLLLFWISRHGINGLLTSSEVRTSRLSVRKTEKFLYKATTQPYQDLIINPRNVAVLR